MNVEINNPKNKFDCEGRPLKIEGNTIISFNNPDEEIYQLGLYVQKAMQAAQLDKNIFLLPPSSFHITVLGVVDNKNRDSKQWPKDLSRQASLTAMNDYAKEAFQKVPLPDEIRLKVNAITPKAIMLEPADRQSKANIFNYRLSLAEELAIPHFDNEAVLFHMSIGYIIEELNSSQKVVFEQIKERAAKQFLPLTVTLNPPQLTEFENMLDFKVIHEK